MFKNMVLALERIERRQRLILEKLSALEKRGEQERENAWLESGIDNILAYQVGEKKGGASA